MEDSIDLLIFIQAQGNDGRSKREFRAIFFDPLVDMGFLMQRRLSSFAGYSSLEAGMWSLTGLTICLIAQPTLTPSIHTIHVSVFCRAVTSPLFPPKDQRKSASVISQAVRSPESAFYEESKASHLSILVIYKFRTCVYTAVQARRAS